MGCICSGLSGFEIRMEGSAENVRGRQYRGDEMRRMETKTELLLVMVICVLLIALVLAVMQ